MKDWEKVSAKGELVEKFFKDNEIFFDIVCSSVGAEYDEPSLVDEKGNELLDLRHYAREKLYEF